MVPPCRQRTTRFLHFRLESLVLHFLLGVWRLGQAFVSWGTIGLGRWGRVPGGEEGNRGRLQNMVYRGRNGGYGGGPLVTDVNQLAANFPKNLEVSQPPKTSQGQHGERVPIKRPDGGGCIAENQRTLQVIHFLVKFDRDVVILQYGIEIERKIEPNPNASPKVSKIEALLVKNEYLSREFPEAMLATAYDGGKNIYSASQLSEGVFELTELVGAQKYLEVELGGDQKRKLRDLALAKPQKKKGSSIG